VVDVVAGNQCDVVVKQFGNQRLRDSNLLMVENNYTDVFNRNGFYFFLQTFNIF